jgi:hypothetical protein
MNHETLFVLLFVFFLVPTPTVFGQAAISLRFLDAGSGKPIKGISIGVSAWDEHEGRQKPKPNGIVKIDKNTQIIKADKDGKAIVHLHDEPSLKTMDITSVGVLRGCSAYQFSIEEVLRSGVVASYHANKPKWCVSLRAQATAKPGEIVIFDKRMTILDRMRHEIP